jgi:hypothetical protein
MNVKLLKPFKIELSSNMTIEELFVLSVGMQKLKKMTKEEINKELEYYSKYLDEDDIKQIASRLHGGMINILKDLKIR